MLNQGIQMSNAVEIKIYEKLRKTMKRILANLLPKIIEAVYEEKLKICLSMIDLHPRDKNFDYHDYIDRPHSWHHKFIIK